jgi:hypothetical protein
MRKALVRSGVLGQMNATIGSSEYGMEPTWIIVDLHQCRAREISLVVYEQ